MDDKSGRGKKKARPKYVWDPRKLTWVEAVEEEPEEVSVEPEVTAVEEEGEAEAAVEPAAEVTEEGAPAAEPASVPDAEGTALGVAEEEETNAVAGGYPVVEAVAEAGGLEYKGALSRFLAFIVDAAILLLISWLVNNATGGGIVLNAATDTVERTAIPYWWVMPVIFLLYFVGFWTWRGQTPGKMLFKARVVKKDGSRIGIVRSLFRFIIYFLYLIVWAVLGGSILFLVVILVILLLIIGLSKKKRGLHDLIAGTIVINSRVPWPQSEVFESEEISETAETSETSETETDKQG